jgi:RimJ/RimL family protein N-acetyltransferase
MALARAAIAMGQSIGWVAGREEPIAAFGCYLMWPGVYSMWLFATDSFPQIGISITKLIVRQILPMLWENGAHRLEARSMEGHHDAQAWLEVIGARREATLRAYGRGGEDFHVYTWERS